MVKRAILVKMNEAARLDYLESQFSHQQKTIDDLSSQVFEQQKSIASLETQVRQLVQRVKDLTLDDGSQAMSANQRPPHY